MFFDRPERGQQAMLVSVRFADSRSDHNLEEFEELVRSAGAEPKLSFKLFRQKRDPKCGIGSGKVSELREEAAIHGIDLILFDCDLSPSQQRSLEMALKCRVLTRTELILTLFEDRAQTREGKLQVELAILKHAQTHVVGGWHHLDRQRGGINMRGAGETQASIDKGLIHRKIVSVERQLVKVQQHRNRFRQKRKKNDITTVALAGYTNAGKSTLFNALTEASAYADDRLFATLDPTTRRLKDSHLGNVVLADTVGFIRDLPLSLVAAFKATLEEVVEADLILHVIDCSARAIDQNMKDVTLTLNEIGAAHVPVINVFNKVDRFHGEVPCGLDGVWVSALEKTGLEHLIDAITKHFHSGLESYELCLAPSEGKLRSWLHSIGAVEKESYTEDGNAMLTVSLSESSLSKVQATEGVQVEALPSAH